MTQIVPESHTGRIGRLFCFALLVVSLGCEARSTEPPRTPGAPIEPFELPTGNGTVVDLRDACSRGRVVVLSFWTTWCGPCWHEMPRWETFWKRYQGRGVELLAIEVGSSREVVQGLVSRAGLSYPVLLDEEREVAAQLRVDRFPTALVLDNECRVVHRQMGLDSRLTRAVDSHLR